MFRPQSLAIFREIVFFFFDVCNVYVKCKMMYKLSTSGKKTRSPWWWPRTEAETCRSNN